MDTPPLKASEVREINRAELLEAETLVFNGQLISQSGIQTMQPGDFYIRPSFVLRTVRPSWFRRVFLRGKETKKTVTVSTVVICCPYCSVPIMGNPDHHLLSRNPLTIDNPITCPYSMANEVRHAFQIKEGNIMPA